MGVEKKLNKRVTVSKEILEELDDEYKKEVLGKRVILAWDEDGNVQILPDKDSVFGIDFIARRTIEVSNYGGARIIIPSNVTNKPENLVTFLKNGIIRIRRGL